MFVRMVNSCLIINMKQISLFYAENVLKMRKMRKSENYADPHHRILSDALWKRFFLRRPPPPPPPPPPTHTHTHTHTHLPLTPLEIPIQLYTFYLSYLPLRHPSTPISRNFKTNCFYGGEYGHLPELHISRNCKSST